VGDGRAESPKDDSPGQSESSIALDKRPKNLRALKGRQKSIHQPTISLNRTTKEFSSDFFMEKTSVLYEVCKFNSLIALAFPPSVMKMSAYARAQAARVISYWSRGSIFSRRKNCKASSSALILKSLSPPHLNPLPRWGRGDFARVTFKLRIFLTLGLSPKGARKPTRLCGEGCRGARA
jgi:hypothetical protein